MSKNRNLINHYSNTYIDRCMKNYNWQKKKIMFMKSGYLKKIRYYSLNFLQIRTDLVGKVHANHEIKKVYAFK